MRIMKKGMELEVNEEEEAEKQGGGDPERKEPEGKETDIGMAKKKSVVKKLPKVEGLFIWTAEHECAFQAIKQAIATNAMAPPDPDLQYHLAVDASKRGIGGVLFQLENIRAYTEATNSEAHRAAERLITFLSFRLEDPETHYSNSKREALAMVRCLAEVKWMVMTSLYPTLVYTDHEALKVLLTGPDNDAHGRIAKWQERLGEYDFQLLHRTAGTHFMGIADGLSRLPTTLMQRAFIEDSEGPRPHPMASGLVTSGQPGIDIRTPMTARLAVSLRIGLGLGFRRILESINTIKVKKHGGKAEHGEGSRGECGAAAVLGGEIGEGGSTGGEEMLGEGATELRRERWWKWLNSGFYGGVIRAKLDGIRAKEEMDMGGNEWQALVYRARRYVMVEGMEGRLIWREKDGQLAVCVLEEDVGKVLRRLHDGHVHFAAGITQGRAHGKYYWPSRQRDIGRWVASCEPCQRMTKMQRCGQLKSVLQFSPMDMIGMDFIGPINPPCEATGATYILLVVDYFSRFVFGGTMGRADQQSTMRFFVDKVAPIVGWPKSVYTDNGSHFTGSAIRKMWEDHGVMQFTAATSHPQSVGLSERYVQMIMGRIRLRCIESGSSKDWGLLV